MKAKEQTKKITTTCQNTETEKGRKDVTLNIKIILCNDRHRFEGILQISKLEDIFLNLKK